MKVLLALSFLAVAYAFPPQFQQRQISIPSGAISQASPDESVQLENKPNLVQAGAAIDALLSKLSDSQEPGDADDDDSDGKKHLPNLVNVVNLINDVLHNIQGNDLDSESEEPDNEILVPSESTPDNAELVTGSTTDDSQQDAQTPGSGESSVETTPSSLETAS